MGRPVVLFIAGMGRSGSTLLGDIFDTFEGVTSVGELHHIWGRGALENWRCGDGPLFRDHLIWQRVVAAVDSSDPEMRVVERHARVERLRARRRALLRDPLQLEQSDSRAYRAEFDAIYKSLAEQTAANLIVDTGKVPFHAAIMQRSTEVDFRVLHLVRDPCAVAFARSQTKPTVGAGGCASEMQRFNSVLAALRWRKRFAEIETLKRTGRYCKLSYEAFCSDPSTHLGAVTDALELPLIAEDLAALAGQRFERKPGLAFSGNPNRLTCEPTRIAPDNRWLQQFGWHNKAVVRSLCGAAP